MRLAKTEIFWSRMDFFFCLIFCWIFLFPRHYYSSIVDRSPCRRHLAPTLIVNMEEHDADTAGEKKRRCSTAPEMLRAEQRKKKGPAASSAPAQSSSTQKVPPRPPGAPKTDENEMPKLSALSSSVLCFQGKKALVLGGTSGIGLAICKQLVQQGAHVIAYSRSTDKCQAAVQQINAEALPGICEAHPLDILECDKLQEAFQAHTGFDYLVAAATGGGRALGPFLEMDMDGFQGSFRKLWGYANAVRYGAPHINPGGSVVLISGSPARKCKPGYVALSCVGGAVENLVRALSKELGARQIRINAVSPGMIDTPMFDGKGPGKAAFLANATADNPLPRPGTADEVAEGVIFCLSNTFVTGTVIDVDGGAVVP